MFTLPQQPPASLETPPVIPVTESSCILNVLLRLCYPLEDKVYKDLQLQDVCAILEAAVKYRIPPAIQRMRKLLNLLCCSLAAVGYCRLIEWMCFLMELNYDQ